MDSSDAMLNILDNYTNTFKFSKLPDPTNHWELVDLIGEGTYGEVYSAKHRKTGEIAAVKILESIHELIEEIEEEYRILNELTNHPNMPKFYGLYLKRGSRVDTQIWLVMEVCARGSVTELVRGLLDEGKRMEEILIAHILKESLQVVHHLHKNHVMHRDIKGHNLLITDRGQIKLIDFGVSSHLSHTLARKKTSVGTPYWMAPEIIACDRQLEYSYDIRSDIWSLGITAIELADGDPPMSDQHPMRVLFKIPRNAPPTIQSSQNWSATFKDFVSRCLVKDFELRPFAHDLMKHPFIKQVPHNTTELKNKLRSLTAHMDRTIPEPEVTSKRGRLKSKRRSQKVVATVDDLATLENLDEEMIVSQLFSRFKCGNIYTYIGDIVLAVNPFTPLTIYSSEYSKMYVNAAKQENPPHIYAVADQSYQMMMHNRQNQCIVISGESGAGKTESANFLVQQLTQLGKAANRTLEERILQVNPLMEAFGNAKTVINDNSSRFGKYLEMLYTGTGTVIGAKITEYLLEKSRVISQAKDEQNFHIFHYVHDGLEEKDALYHLKENTVYRYILEHTSRKPEIATISQNRVKFKAIQHCLDIIGFQEDEIAAIYSVIAGVLHLGNINFHHKEQGHTGESAVISNMNVTIVVSHLLAVSTNDFVEALTTTSMVARGEVIIQENSVQEAAVVRDAMAKSLYGRLFSWIVNRINTLLKPHSVSSSDTLVIGLLDIFGFENFPQNSFEQLCINIANEQIQFYFNQHIFAWEMQEYKSEGLEGINISFVDNRPVLDMFLMKPMGLLALLDEESHFPKATDMTLIDKFSKNIHKVQFSRPKGHNLMFCIAHYAGKVTYDGHGFLEKNRDRLPVEVLNLLRSSKKAVIRVLFQTPLTRTGNLASGTVGSSVRSNSKSGSQSSPSGTGYISVMSANSKGSASMGGSRGSGSASMTRIQQTVSTYFRFSLMDLLAKMVAGTPHFVRCIRPNEEKMPDDFNSEKVKVQLRYTGVLETTRIRREGFSHRIPFSEFLKRYYILGFAWDEPVPYSRESCKVLLQRMGLNDWALGNTKVFLKYYHIEQLARKFEEYNKHVIHIQSVMRMRLTRSKYYRLKWQRQKAVVQIQAAFRAWRVRRTYKRMNRRRSNAAVVIQKNTRGFLTRVKVLPDMARRRRAVTLIQSAYRGHMTRKNIRSRREEERKNAIRIQQVRDDQARVKKQKLQVKERAAKIIQRNFRNWQVKCHYRQLHQVKMIAIAQDNKGENKANDWNSNVIKNNNQRSPKSPVPGPSRMESLSPVRSRKQVAKHPKKAPLDIGTERLEHLQKMQESKTLMPEPETRYYDQLIFLGHNTMSNGIDSDSSLCPQIKKPDGEHLQKRRIGQTPPSSGSNRGLDWDKPHVQARAKIMSQGLHSSHSGSVSIEQDLMTDREELFNEKDREELTHRLEQEVASSIVALWRQNMKEHHEHEDNELSEKSDMSSSAQRVKWSDNVLEKQNGGPVTKRPYCSPNPASKYRISGKRTVIPIRMFDSDSAVDNEEEDDAGKFDFRAKLRKTNIDLTSTIRMKTSAESAQLDYRHQLRRTGRLVIPTKDS